MKYPRTYHFDFSPGVSSDDKIIKDLSRFVGSGVIISEKMDGESTSMSCDKIWARSLDSKHHPSREWVKNLWGQIRYDIPDGYRVCGENLYAKHSIYYDNLASYFMCFNIWDGIHCLPWNETVEWCSLLGLEHVPVIFEGLFDLGHVKDLAEKLNYNKQEGLVVRIADGFDYDNFNKCVAKWVRSGHVQTDDHWMNSEIVCNKLR